MGLPLGNGLPPIEPDPGLFAGIVAAVVSALNFILNLLIAIANFLWNVILAIVRALVAIFQAGWQFLKHVWDNFIKPAVSWIARHIQALRDWLKRVLKPVIKFLQKLKRWYDTHILAQQLRLLKMIQTIRRFLAILRILHIKWASTLDNALVDVQNRIQQSIAIVRGTLNQIINTLALVLDPTLFITRNVLGGTLLSNLGAIKRIFGYGDNRILSASEQATIDKQHSLYFTSTVKAHLQALKAGGPTQDDQDNRKAARQALADATNAPLPF